MKVGRVGGLKNAIKIHDMAMDANLSMWCGGMFETIIGRATNLHLATMPNFTLSNDITTASNLSEPIAEPLLYRNRQDSTIAVPKGAGIGVTVMPNILAKYHIRQAVFSKNGHIAETTSNFSQKLDRNTKHITSLPTVRKPRRFTAGSLTKS